MAGGGLAPWISANEAGGEPRSSDLHNGRVAMTTRGEIVPGGVGSDAQGETIDRKL